MPLFPLYNLSGGLCKKKKKKINYLHQLSKTSLSYLYLFKQTLFNV